MLHTPISACQRNTSRIVRSRVVCPIFMTNPLSTSLAHPFKMRMKVWQAGWWDPEQAAKNGSRKGKERDQGERPEMTQKGLRRVELLDGCRG